MIAYIKLDDNVGNCVFLLKSDNNDSETVTIKDLADKDYKDSNFQCYLDFYNSTNDEKRLLPFINLNYKGDKFTDITNIYKVYLNNVILNKRDDINKKLEAIVTKSVDFVTYEDMSKAMKEFYVFSELEEPTVVFNTNLIVNTNSLNKDEVVSYLAEINASKSVEEASADEDRVMETPISEITMRVPNLYEVWQMSSRVTSIDELDIVGEREVPINPRDLTEGTQSIDIYKVSKDTEWLCGGEYNIGVFNKILSKSTISELLDVDYKNNGGDIDLIEGTKANSFMAIQPNEVSYYEKLKELMNDGIVYENYDGSHGPIDLRKSYNVQGIKNNDKPLADGITIQEAYDYVDLEDLISKQVKSEIVMEYLLWLSDFAMCANRPHLGFAKYPDIVGKYLDNELDYRLERPSINVSEDGEEADDITYINSDSARSNSPEALRYKNLKVFISDLDNTYDPIEAVIKLLRWGIRKVRYLKVDSGVYSFDLQEFKSEYIRESDNTPEDLVIMADGVSNRVVGSLVVLDNFKDAIAVSGATNKRAVIGLRIYRDLKTTKQISLAEIVDLESVITEYIDNGNENYKIYGLDYDKYQGKFVYDDNLFMEAGTGLDNDNSIMMENVDSALRDYNEGNGVVPILYNYKVISIIDNENLKSVGYNQCNLFSSLLKLSQADSVNSIYKNLTKKKRDYMRKLSSLDKLHYKETLVKYSVGVRYLEWFKVCSKFPMDIEDFDLAGLLNLLKDIKVNVGELSDSNVNSGNDTYNDNNSKGIGSLGSLLTNVTANSNNNLKSINNAITIYVGEEIKFYVASKDGDVNYKFYLADEVNVTTLLTNRKGKTVTYNLDAFLGHVVDSIKTHILKKYGEFRPQVFDKMFNKNVGFESLEVLTKVKEVFNWEDYVRR